VCFYDNLLEGEENLHSAVLKEYGKGGDDPSLLCMHLPVLPLIEDLNIWRRRERRWGLEDGKMRENGGQEGGGREGEEVILQFLQWITEQTAVAMNAQLPN